MIEVGEYVRTEKGEIFKVMMEGLTYEMAEEIATSDNNICDYLDITDKCQYYAGENKKTCEECLKEYFMKEDM